VSAEALLREDVLAAKAILRMLDGTGEPVPDYLISRAKLDPMRYPWNAVDSPEINATHPGSTQRGDVRPDFDVLRAAARAALHHSYAPYSSFPVGAAALVDDGRVVSGASVENASFGVALRAEDTLIGQLQMTGGGRLVAFISIDGAGGLVLPEGRSRQLLFEFGGPDLLVDTPRGILAISEFLPDTFDSPELEAPAQRPLRDIPPLGF